MKTLEEIHKKCGEIFSEKLSHEGGRTVACRVWDKLTDGKENCDNCLGENFNQLLLTIEEEFFTNYTPSVQTGRSYYFYNSIFWLYLIAERVYFVFEVINKGDTGNLFREFKHKNFSITQKIKKWANFIKHPKEFLFTHWPQFLFKEELNILPDIGSYIIIDDEFVKTHYSGDKTTPISLTNNPNVIILIPDLEELTKQFCDEMIIFFDFIIENKIVAEYLKDKSTIEYIIAEQYIPEEVKEWKEKKK